MLREFKEELIVLRDKVEKDSNLDPNQSKAATDGLAQEAVSSGSPKRDQEDAKDAS